MKTTNSHHSVRALSVLAALATFVTASAIAVNYTNTILPGYNFVACPVVGSPDNDINNLNFVRVPPTASDPNGVNNAVLYVWNCVAFNIYQYFTGPDADIFFGGFNSPDGWYDSVGNLASNVIWNPGRGMIIYDRTAASWAFVFLGNPPDPGQPVLTCGCDHYNLLGNPTPNVGTYFSITGHTPYEGAIVKRHVSGMPAQPVDPPNYTVNNYAGGIWSLGNPILNSMEAAWFFVPCQTNCVPPPEGMSAWWPFDESSGGLANDIAGLVNNLGRHVNGPTSVLGMVGNALCFDGLDDYVLVTNQSEINFLGNCASRADSFTVDAWIRAAANPNGPTVQPLLDKRSTANGWQGYSLYLWNGNLGFQIATGPGGNNNYSSTGPDLRDDQWHFIAVTVQRCTNNGNTGVLYVDGAAVWNFQDFQTGDINNSADLIIGRHATSAQYYTGCIDELEIIKRALTPGEILAIYHAGSAGKCKGTLCGTKFNDLNGDGVRQAGEPGLGGWVIQAMVGGIPVAATITDTNGNYCFTNLPGGWAVISEVQQSGWVQTAPVGGNYAFTNQPGMILGGLDFGNQFTNCCEPPWNPNACCTNCNPPYLLTKTVTVLRGVNFLVNPFCHGTNNTVGVLLPNVGDGSALNKWNVAIQAYDPAISFDRSFGGWVDPNFNDASDTPLPPGEGFVLMNYGAPYTITFIGCEPDIACRRCRPTNVLWLVGAIGVGPTNSSWSDLFRCPPKCGTELQIWNGVNFDTYTFLTSWTPGIPSWPAGTSVFVSVQPNTNCCEELLGIICGVATNGMVTTNEPGRCDAVVNYPPPTVSGGCPPIVTNCAPPTGSRFPVGTTTVVCTASDSAGHTAQCSFPVTVLDREPPLINCATNKLAECGTPWQFDWPTASDNCCTNPQIVIVSTSTNGSCPWLISRIWRATDCYSNSSLCTQIVTVVDTTAPMITCASNRIVPCGTNWAFDQPQISDACCPSNTLTLVAHDSVATNKDHCETVFTRIWQVTDCCSNTASCSQSVTVVRATPTPVVISCHLDASGLHLTFATETCVKYIVEYKANLNAPAWTTLAEVEGDGALHEVVDGPLQQMRFYRIRAVCQTERFSPSGWP